MSVAIEALLLAAIAPFVAAAAYLALLAVLATAPARRPARAATDWRRFAFVIPARNEEPRIGALIESLRALDYPRERVVMLVVADNCSDRTARAAREAGAEVVERRDAVRVGKGYALAYGIQRLPPTYDAVVFVDGDCTVTPGFLRALSRPLDDGADVVQAFYTMEPSGPSATRAVRTLALALVHLVRPLAKERIRASVGLKGSGMCFTRQAIGTIGWSETGLAEDIEQHVRVLRSGRRVAFARDAVVTGASPGRLRDARGQHRRWEAGRAAAARRDGLPLLAEGLRSRSIARVDAAVELLVPPLSVVAAALLLAAAAGGAMRWAAVWGSASFGLACIGCYVLSGLVALRLGWRGTLAALASMPLYALWKLRVYATSMIARPDRWEQTRDAEEARAR